MDLVSGRRGVVTVVILATLTALGPLSMDAYLPAFPQLGQDLGIEASAVQLTLAANVVGIVLGQLLLSPLTDQYGRRRIVIAATIVLALASFGQAAATSFGVLITLRFVAGLAAGAGIAISRAIAADVAKGEKAARLFSLFIALSSVAPIVAPLVGGALLAATGTWRSSFVALGAVGVVLTAALVVAIPETLAPADRHAGGLGQLGRAFSTLIRDRAFVGYALVLVFAYSALFAYLSGGPFVLQEQYGLSANAYSVVFAVNATGLVVLGFVNARLVKRYAPRRLLAISLVIAAGAGVLLVGAMLLHIPGVALVLIGLFVVVASRGMMTANAMFLGVDRAQARGMASAILGAGMFAGGILVTPAVGLTPERPGDAMSIAILVGTLLALAALALTRTSGGKIDERMGS